MKNTGQTDKAGQVGTPGADINVRIRGTSSVYGGNNPLFVIDGVPLSGDNTSSGGDTQGIGRMLGTQLKAVQEEVIQLKNRETISKSNMAPIQGMPTRLF